MEPEINDASPEYLRSRMEETFANFGVSPDATPSDVRHAIIAIWGLEGESAATRLYETPLARSGNLAGAAKFLLASGALFALGNATTRKFLELLDSF